jgi:hypothetical protein
VPGKYGFGTLFLKDWSKTRAADCSVFSNTNRRVDKIEKKGKKSKYLGLLFRKRNDPGMRENQD